MLLLAPSPVAKPTLGIGATDPFEGTYALLRMNMRGLQRFRGSDGNECAQTRPTLHHELLI